MRDEQIKEITDEHFKRLTGMKKHTLSQMVKIVSEGYQAKHRKCGRQSSLSMKDMVLLMLTYFRSYSTFFELGVMFNVSESTAHRITIWVEDVLVASGQFALPSKKVLLDVTRL